MKNNLIVNRMWNYTYMLLECHSELFGREGDREGGREREVRIDSSIILDFHYCWPGVYTYMYIQFYTCVYIYHLSIRLGVNEYKAVTNINHWCLQTAHELLGNHIHTVVPQAPTYLQLVSTLWTRGNLLTHRANHIISFPNGGTNEE